MPHRQLAHVESVWFTRLAEISFLATHTPRSASHCKILHMTPAQEEALKKVQAILGEHFAGHVLITIEEVDSEERGEVRRITYDGGYHQALGLLCKAQHQMLTDFSRLEE